MADKRGQSKHRGGISDAVALQDHMIQRLGLSLKATFPVRLPGIRSGAAPRSNGRQLPQPLRPIQPPCSEESLAICGARAPTTVARLALKPPAVAVDDVLKLLGEARECEACGASCRLHIGVCSACNHVLPPVQVRERTRPFTLAQQRGLMPAPAPLLTATDWAQVEARCAARGDSTCSICLQIFGMRDQVLTSCSHSFHASCLNSMERFMGTRSCPVCREAGYQRRRTRHGAYKYIEKCIMRVQAVWRGHATRLRFFALRKKLYLEGEQGGGDPDRRRVFIGELLGDLHVHIAIDSANRRAAVDALVSESDAAVAASRRVLEAVAESAARRLKRSSQPIGAAPEPASRATGPAGSPQRLGRGSVASLLDDLAVRLLAAEARQEQLAATRSALADARRQLERQSAHAIASQQDRDAAFAPVLTSAQWVEVHNTSRARGHAQGDCPVCIMPLEEVDMTQCALLSCGHVFHTQCIASFEAFAVGNMLQRSSRLGEDGQLAATARMTRAAPRCPLCRTGYSRTSFNTIL